MQPSSTQDIQVVSYQNSRSALIRVWWRCTMFQKRTFLALTIWVVLAVCCLALPGALRGLGFVPLMFVLLAPLNVYQLYAKRVDSDPLFTEKTTLEFNFSRLLMTGANWKSEMLWSRFKRLSEDDDYFYLYVDPNGLPSVFPKAAFSPEQQLTFRGFAKAVNS